MKLLFLLPLLLGFSVPAIAHNEANGGCGFEGYHCGDNQDPGAMVEEGVGAETGDVEECPPTCGGGVPRPVRPISN